SSETEQPALVGDTWEGVLEDFGRSQLELLLVEYLPKQRWFGDKARQIRGARIVDWGELAQSTVALVLVEVEYETGLSDCYLLFLATSYGLEADRLRHAGIHDEIVRSRLHGHADVITPADEKRYGSGLGYVPHVWPSLWKLHPHLRGHQTQGLALRP